MMLVYRSETNNNFARIFFLILLSFFCCSLFSQTPEIDSLYNDLKKNQHDTSRIITLMNISEAIYLINPDSDLAACKRVVELTEKALLVKNNVPADFYLKCQADALNNIGYIIKHRSDLTKALEYYNRSLEIQLKIKEEKGAALTLNNIGAIYDDQGNTSKALECYDKSITIRRRIDDKKGIAGTLNNIGNIYIRLGDIPKALEYNFQSLKIAEAIKEKRSIAQSFNNIGRIYDEQGDLQNALAYYEKSLKLRTEIHDQRGIGESLSNIGLFYHDHGDKNCRLAKQACDSLALNKALDYYTRALKIELEINHYLGASTCLNNIGGVYKSLGNFTKAIEYYKKSLAMREFINDKQGICISLNNISIALYETSLANNSVSPLPEAFDYSFRSLKLSRQLGYPDDIMNAASVLKRIYKKQNKFKEALEMNELEIQMRDSLNNEQTKKTAIKKQFQYEYEKRLATDSIKNSEERKIKDAKLTAQNARLKQEKTQFWFLSIGLAFLLAGLVFAVSRFRITRKQKEIIELQKIKVDSAFEKLHEKNKEVMDSIHYARRIQRALITNEKYIERVLNKLGKSAR